MALLQGFSFVRAIVPSIVLQLLLFCPSMCLPGLGFSAILGAEMCARYVYLRAVGRLLDIFVWIPMQSAPKQDTFLPYEWMAILSMS